MLGFMPLSPGLPGKNVKSEAASLFWKIAERIQTMVRELNSLYRREPSLYEVDDSYQGFEWIDFRDSQSSVISFIRFARDREDFIVFCFNLTPVPRHNYRVGVPKPGAPVCASV